MTAVRAPVLILHPRLWAEQGSVYLAYALSHGVLRSLLLVPTSEGPAGYLHLSANLAAVLAAHAVPLEWAAALTTALAFAIQLLPFAVVLWGRSLWWTTAQRRIACCLVLLFSPAINPKVWLSAVNSQIFCGLVVLLLLFEDLDGASRRRIWTTRALLVFCCLSGGYGALLAIPYFVRARLAGGREAAIQAMLTAASAVVQLTCYVANVDLFAPPGHRLGIDATKVPVVVLVHHVLRPIFGGWLTELAGTGLRGILWFTIGAATLVAVGVWLSRRRTDPLFRLLPLSFGVLVLGVSVLGFGLPVARYAVLPGLVTVVTLLVAGWSEDPPRRRRVVCRILVGVALTAGVATYWRDESGFGKGVTFRAFGELPGRPDWPEEVELWRADPGYTLRIWPYGGDVAWPVRLTRQGEFDAIRDALARVGDLHLVANAGRSEARIPLAGLPADFKLRIAGSSSHSIDQVALGVSLEGEDGGVLGDVSVRRLRAGGRFADVFNAKDFDLEPGRSFTETGEMVLTLESRTPEPAVVAIDTISVVPRIEGLLDGVLPERTVPARLYSGSSARPLAGEATPVLALASLVRDGDRRFTEEDRARAGERWRTVPEGLRLRRGGLAGPVFDEPLPFLLAALPFFAAAGPAGVVVLNLLLFAAAVVLLWRDFAAAGVAGRWFAAASMLGAAGFGFVFLPQSQVFQMVCLVLPVRAWLSGRLTFVSGVLLALAAVEEPAWLVLAALILGERFLAGERRAVARAATGGLIVVLLLGALPAWLDPAGAPLPSGAGGALGAARSGFFAEAWTFYTGRRGLVAGYPFVFLALWAMTRGGQDPRRLMLLGGLVALTVWILWQDAAGGRLGSPHFAVIFPLFALLPTRIGSWKWLLAPTAVAVLLSWGLASAGWTPP